MMPRTLQRADVSDVVLRVIQGWHFDFPIREETQFGTDLPLDKKVKGLYFYAIRIRLENLGYVFCNFKLEDCEDAGTIGDIVETIWEDVNPESKHVM